LVGNHCGVTDIIITEEAKIKLCFYQSLTILVTKRGKR